MPILYGSMEEFHTKKMNQGWIVEQIYEQKLNGLRDSLSFQWSQCGWYKGLYKYKGVYVCVCIFKYKKNKKNGGIRNHMIHHAFLHEHVSWEEISFRMGKMNLHHQIERDAEHTECQQQMDVL